MRIIHCADLHLDSALDANFTMQQSAERSAELRSTFCRLVAYAKAHQVRVVMICGDLFDSARATAATVQLVLDEIENAPDTDFLYLRGNHDTADLLTGMELPGNLKLFSEGWTSYVYDNVVITGAELTPQNNYAPYGALQLSPECCNIVMLHGQVGAAAGKDCVALPLLKGRNIDYLALGHIHSFSGDRLDARGAYCYSGCLEGRGFDECGSKGFILVETTAGGGLTPRFIPFAKRTLEEISVDITPVADGSFPQLRAMVEAATARVSETAMVKVTLTGTCSPETPKDLRLLTLALNERFYLAVVRDETRLAVEPESYLHDISLKGAFMRAVLAKEPEGTQRDRILRCGLQALKGEAIEL